MFRDDIEIRFRFTIKTNIRENDPPKTYYNSTKV